MLCRYGNDIYFKFIFNFSCRRFVKGNNLALGRPADKLKMVSGKETQTMPLMVTRTGTSERDISARIH